MGQCSGEGNVEEGSAFTALEGSDQPHHRVISIAVLCHVGRGRVPAPVPGLVAWRNARLARAQCALENIIERLGEARVGRPTAGHHFAGPAKVGLRARHAPADGQLLLQAPQVVELVCQLDNLQ